MTVRLDYRRRKPLAPAQGDCGDQISIAAVRRRRGAADSSSCLGGSRAMGRAGQGADHSCNCPCIEPSTRRGFLTIVSLLGLNLAALPALAQRASERPKEEDFLVAVDCFKEAATNEIYTPARHDALPSLPRIR